MNQTTNTTASIDLAQLDKLEALAQAATPGDWIACRFGRLIGGPERHYVNGSAQAQIASFSVTFHEQAPDDEPERQQANTEFAAGFSPKTALALIELARRSLTSPSISSSVESLSRASGEERFLTSGAPAEPVDMILHCPVCSLQHIDAPEVPPMSGQVFGLENMRPLKWTNPPHRSHLCHGCGHIWRPADVPTNGVKAITSKGANDSPVHDTATPSAAQASVDWIYSVLRDVGELDYDSPEDPPDLMMVTTDELFTIIRRHAPSAGAAAKTEQAPCDNCDGEGGWKTDEWIDPVSGPECTAERCEVCMGSGIDPATAAGAGSDQAGGPDNWALPGIPTGCHIQVDVAANLCENHDFLTCASTLRAISDAMKAGRQKSASPSVPVQGERALFEAAEEAKGHFANILERGPTSPTRRDALAGIAALDHAIQARAALYAAPVPQEAEPTNTDMLQALVRAEKLLRAAGFAMNGTASSKIVAAIAKHAQEAEQAAPAAVTALSDADVVAVLASLGIDAEPSKYGFDTLQVHTTVPAIRDIVGAYLEFQPAAPAVTDAARDVLADAKGGA